MGKKRNKSKIPKLTEEEYARYVMSLKDEKPIDAYRKTFEDHVYGEDEDDER